jgi:glycosyltransferase involved in cell wall biosynthesis
VSRPLVSVVTPSLDQAPFVERTVQSVLSQRGDVDLEYLVVDGGSRDGTLEILSRYRDRIRLVVEPDHGQADAVNKGLRMARGEILGWVNSDDLLRPRALERVVLAFREAPGTSWLHGRCDIVDPEDRVIRRWVTRYKNHRARRHDLASLLVENYVSQMTVFWRRSLQERVGLLDEGLRYTFDYDLWLRFARESPPLFLEETLAAFRWHPATKSGSSFERQFEEDHQVFLRHAPDDAGLRHRKRRRTAQIVLAYRLLRALRGASSRAGGGDPVAPC